MVSQRHNLENITIANTHIEHGEEINQVIRLAFGSRLDEPCPDCIGPEAIEEHLARFPEGQFVALYHDGQKTQVVGVAVTMRTIEPPTETVKTWIEKIGTVGIANHQPTGQWLYGVDMAVHPDFRQLGIGTQLYQARFDLCKRLNLRGWYAAGMLMGYRFHRDQMSPREYGEKVLRGELRDPTVTMQINRGFKPIAVVENYMEEEFAGDAAILIVWDNPDYQED